MFKFFKSNRNYEPLDFELRNYFENCLLWLKQEFPNPPLENRKVLTPTFEDFPIKWNQSEENAFDVLKIVCQNMQINESKVIMDFFQNAPKEINSGSQKIFLKKEEGASDSIGFYLHKNQKGKYGIAIDADLLNSPENLIATIAHELCHLKLLGEKKLKDNDEILTDYSTVFFGLGIFNANASFQFNNNSEFWEYRSSGYMKISEWAYGLAIFALLRKESNPTWSKYLSKSVKSEFDKCLKYVFENEKDIFKN
ncbi:MAG: hypothetical protein WDA08_10900 [Weeksellaceae bacterium]